MKQIIRSIKEEIKILAEEITQLKKLKNDYDRKNYSYWDLPYLKKYNSKIYTPIRIFHNGEFYTITSVASITDEMLKEQDANHKLYSDCRSKLVVAQYMYRHLSILYGMFRGKDRSVIERKWNKVPYSYNYITKKGVNSSDPVDWAFIDYLRNEYTSKLERLTNE